MTFKNKLTEAEREELLAKYLPLYEAGWSFRRIAQNSGHSYGYMYALLSEGGVKPRRRGGDMWTRVREAELADIERLLPH